MEKEFKVELGFVQRRLPWIMAGAILVIYAVTLSTSATFGGLGILAQVAGWDWRPSVVAPLHVILTLPVRWLPAGAQLTALNFLTALFAAATVGLLARSVSLLPHDRTKEQRAAERNDYSLLSNRAAWLPPVLAALVCGLQLTFWENAVVASGEALDLLLFAYLIRCLLEYRLDENESWLTRFALIYGLAVANNYAMIGFFPPFLVALVWIKWTGFFNGKFIGRMAAWGAAGLALYLVLPAVNSQTGDFSFWELLRGYWSIQKNQLQSLPRYIVMLISLTSVAPVLFMGIRWPASLGDISAAGNALTNLMMHVIHATFFLACLYVAFDPPFSPRHLGFGRFALLPFYYLGALSIGYYAGYLLLVFHSKPPPPGAPRRSALRVILGPVIVAIVWIAAIAVPAGLIYQNLAKVRQSTGASLSRMAAAAARSLPEQGAILLSDDMPRLFAVQLELQKLNPGHGHMLVDTTQLSAAGYHRFLQQKHPQRWPKFRIEAPPGTVIDSATQAELLSQLARSNQVYYLHPSFGYFFEFFYAQPQDFIYRLQPYPTNAISGPALTAAELKRQDEFWKKFKTAELDPLLKKLEPINAAFKASKFKEQPTGMEAYAGAAYSRALNHFGVEAQRSGDLKMAGDYFDLALQCNAGNPAAFINQQNNLRLKSGQGGGVPPNEENVQRLAPYASAWESLLGLHGPVDEPGIGYYIARSFDAGGIHRQAAQLLERSAYFEPTNLAFRVALIMECIQIPLPDQAMSQITELRTKPPVPLKLPDELELLRAEAWVRFQKNDLPGTEKLLTDAQQKHPAEPVPFTTLMQIYVNLQRSADAMAVLENQLKVQPANYTALINYAAMLIGSGKLKDAVTYLDRALKLKPQESSALLNRALANLYSEPPQIDAALEDYRLLESILPERSHLVYFGLGQCYRLKKMRKESLKYFRKYLEVAPRNLPERRIVEDYIKKLDSGSF